MAFVGNYRDNYDRWDYTAYDQSNVIVGELQFPENGWITDVGVHAGGFQGSTGAHLVVYAMDGTVAFISTRQVWDDTRRHRFAALADGSGEYRIFAGNRQRVGIWGEKDAKRAFSLSDRTQRKHHRGATPGTGPNHPVPSLSDHDGELGVYASYIPNQQPGNPVFVGPTPSGFAPSLTPSFTVRANHPASEAGRDYTALVQLQIYDEGAKQVVFNTVKETPYAKDGFEDHHFAAPFTHQPNRTYRPFARTQDSFGVWSEWDYGLGHVYSTGSGPATPQRDYDRFSPSFNTRNPTSGIQYEFWYQHVNSVALQAVQIQVTSPDGGAVYYDSGWRTNITKSTTPFYDQGDAGTYKLAQFHQTLREDTEYAYRVRVRDANGVVSHWSFTFTFGTNARPLAPSNLAPSGGGANGSGILSCTVRDPDGDPITAVHFRLYNSAGTEIGFYPVTPQGGVATVDVSAAMTLGQNYSWFAVATDGKEFGPGSNRAHFLYALAPEVGFLAPAFSGLLNLIPQPSAEYTPAVRKWTFAGTDTVLSSMISGDGDAAFGPHAYEISKQGGNGSAVFTASGRIAVSASSRLAFLCRLKYMSGVAANFTMSLACFDSLGASLGSVFIEGYSTPKAAAASWGATHGGLSGALPAGTAFVEPRITFSNGDVFVVRVDALFLAELPGTTTTAQWETMRYWFGYFDGDEPGYAGNTTDYYWLGAIGDSASGGLSILTRQIPTIAFSYFSPGGVAKQGHQFVVHRLNAGSYSKVYDSGPRDGVTALTLDIPQGIIKNEGRYRIRNYVWDANYLLGDTGWVEFDVRYDGPPEPTLLGVGQEVRTGTLNITWRPSEIQQENFVRFEVAAESMEEGEVVFFASTDNRITAATYYFPVSGRSYKVKVRQVERNSSGEEVESRWVGGTVGVDYFPRRFIKSVRDPLKVISFIPLVDDSIDSEPNAPIDEYLPLLSDGNSMGRPIHVIGPHRHDTGDLSVTLTDNVDIPPEEQQRVADAMKLGDRFVCLLDQEPASKRFVTLNSIKTTPVEFLGYALDASWTETRYDEREGR